MTQTEIKMGTTAYKRCHKKREETVEELWKDDTMSSGDPSKLETFYKEE
jgi:hypothetical protein